MDESASVPRYEPTRPLPRTKTPRFYFDDGEEGKGGEAGTCSIARQPKMEQNCHQCGKWRHQSLPSEHWPIKVPHHKTMFTDGTLLQDCQGCCFQTSGHPPRIQWRFFWLLKWFLTKITYSIILNSSNNHSSSGLGLRLTNLLSNRLTMEKSSLV